MVGTGGICLAKWHNALGIQILMRKGRQGRARKASIILDKYLRDIEAVLVKFQLLEALLLPKI